MVACTAVARPQALPLSGLEADLQTEFSRSGAAGMSIVVAQSGAAATILNFGHADVKRRIPISDQTRFRLGSMSKPFVAAALMKLVEAKSMDLDQEVARLIPDVPIHNAWNKESPIRFIHLLEHTAGFDDMRLYMIHRKPEDPERSVEELVHAYGRGFQCRWRPGTRYAYSNPGYLMAALVIERLSGGDYRAFIDQTVLKPLGMLSSGYYPISELETRAYIGEEQSIVPQFETNMNPGGGLQSTPADVAKWLKVLVDGGDVRSRVLFSERQYRRFLTPESTLAAAAGIKRGYAKGTFSFIGGRRPHYSQGGNIDEFNSVLDFNPDEGWGFAILINGAYPQLQDAIEESLLKTLSKTPDSGSTRLAQVKASKPEGFYELTNPRAQLEEFAQPFFGISYATRDSTELKMQPIPVGPAARYTLLPGEAGSSVATPSLVAAVDPDGVSVLADGFTYYRKIPMLRAVGNMGVGLVWILALVLGPLLVIRDIKRTRYRIPWAVRIGMGGLIVFPFLLIMSAYFLLQLRNTLDATGWHARTLFAVTWLLLILPCIALLSLGLQTAKQRLVISVAVASIYLSFSAYLLYTKTIPFTPWNY